jgi:DNA repair photolyase
MIKIKDDNPPAVGNGIIEQTAKTILRKHKCVYCDGRSERYYVNGEFGKNIAVKINAIEILRKELGNRRRHAPLKNGFMMVGGGVGDSYQSVEKKYKLTRRALHLLYDLQHPVHVLTKSTLI